MDMELEIDIFDMSACFDLKSSRHPLKFKYIKKNSFDKFN